MPASDINNRIKGDIDYGDGRKVTGSDQLMKFWARQRLLSLQEPRAVVPHREPALGQAAADLDTKAIIGKVNREDMWREAAKNIWRCRRRHPQDHSRGKETFFDGKVFDPADPKAYLASLQIKKVA